MSMTPSSMLSATSMLALLGSGDGSDSAATMSDFCKCHSGLHVIISHCVLCEDGPQFIVNSSGKPLDLFALNKGPFNK